MKLHPKVEAALEATGKPWTLERGAKHFKIRLDGKCVAVWPFKPKDQPRRIANLVAAIRRST